MRHSAVVHELLLVGSVPLRPASRVFDVLAERLPGLLVRVPDGDQHGWVIAALQSFIRNPNLERCGQAELSRDGIAVPLFRLKPGVTSAELVLGPYGFAETAIRSYTDFVERRAQGRFPKETRFQVTFPGPGTSAYFLQLPPEELLPLARTALLREIERLVATVPSSDLAIQLDIAMEAEHEEWRRRPHAFDTPIHKTFDWTLEQMADSAAWLANQIPSEAELGFHICSIWHHYPHGGQDNNVLVEAANAIVSRLKRPLGYLHVPTIPQHAEPDFRPLANLRLQAGAKLYLGVIHGDDGLEGALRRIDAARKFVPEFGIASFCGLGNPAVNASPDDAAASPFAEAKNPEARSRQATTRSFGEGTGNPLIYVLDLHRQLAQKSSR